MLTRSATSRCSPPGHQPPQLQGARTTKSTRTTPEAAGQSDSWQRRYRVRLRSTRASTAACLDARFHHTGQNSFSRIMSCARSSRKRCKPTPRVTTCHSASSLSRRWTSDLFCFGTARFDEIQEFEGSLLMSANGFSPTHRPWEASERGGDGDRPGTHRLHVGDREGDPDDRVKESPQISGRRRGRPRCARSPRRHEEAASVDPRP